jgi:hypothetical protein
VIFRRIWILALALVGLVFGACAKTSTPTPPAENPSVLVKSDIKSFAMVNAESLRDYDDQHSHLFTEIFGGTTGSDVKNYLGMRIHYFLKEDDVIAITPKRKKHDDWNKDDSPENAVATSKSQLMALNVGTGFWLQGLVDQTSYKIQLADETITITSSRTGVMAFGPGYRSTVQIEASNKYPNGLTITLPPEYRQSTLVHEARHSDCTGGITESDLEQIRGMKSARDFDEKFKNPTCGHLHAYCPPGHDLADLPACDRTPWGAYTVSAIYATAVGHRMSGIDRAVMDSKAVDQWSRLLFDKEAMMEGKLGQPDMSSAGFR